MRLIPFDWTYLVFIVPCVILSLFCQFKVQSNFPNTPESPTLDA